LGKKTGESDVLRKTATHYKRGPGQGNGGGARYRSVGRTGASKKILSDVALANYQLINLRVEAEPGPEG